MLNIQFQKLLTLASGLALAALTAAFAADTPPAKMTLPVEREPQTSPSEEHQGCREELIFQIVRPKLADMLRRIRLLRSLLANLEVDSADKIPGSVKAHLPEIKTALAALLESQHATRSILQDALKARVSKRKEQTDELVHDLGTILSPVSYVVTLLEIPAAPNLNEHRDDLATMATGLQTAEKLIRERIRPVINVAKFVSLKTVVNVNDILEIIRITYGNSFPAVTVVPHATPLYIRVDDLAVFTAISNLCKNAQEAIVTHQNGRGRIAVRASLQDQAEAVVIEVADDGPGVPPDAQLRMLERNQSEKGAGRGVGLTSVQRTVFDHGGDFYFQSSTKPEDHGTTFQMRFPPATPTKEVK